MVETIAFFKALSVSVLFLSLLSGFFYWIYVLINKKYQNIKFHLKYKVFRRKFNENDVVLLLDDAERGVNETELINALILSNKVTPEKAKELLYIYSEIKKNLKGGVKNE